MRADGCEWTATVLRGGWGRAEDARASLHNGAAPVGLLSDIHVVTFVKLRNLVATTGRQLPTGVYVVISLDNGRRTPSEHQKCFFFSLLERNGGVALGARV